MKVVQPISITSENLVDSNLFDVAPTAFAAGTTYALGAYVGVAGTLGEVLVYQSLQAGNTGHTPSSSPTWWVYVSSTYGEYSTVVNYTVQQRIFDSATDKIRESLFSSNLNYPLDNSAKWLELSSSGRYDFTLPFFVGTTTYTAGTIVVSDQASAGDINHITFPVFKSITSGNTGHGPDTSPTWWQFVGFAVPVYAPEATYTIGEIISDGKGKYYQCLASGVYRQPLTGLVAWLEVSPSNRTAMFDSQTVTQSVANKKISVTVASGIIDTVALVNTDAELATITVRDGLGGTVVFQKTIGLTGGNPTNAWDYYFGDPTVRITQAVVEGIPPYVNSHVTVEITGNSEVKVGNLIMGKSVDMGLTITGATAGILDFSTKTTDTFGQTTFVRRGYKKTLAVQVEVQKEKTNKLQNTLYALRSQPCLWISTNDPELSEPLVLFGFYKDFSTEISYPTYSLCSIEIEGLI